MIPGIIEPGIHVLQAMLQGGADHAIGIHRLGWAD